MDVGGAFGNQEAGTPRFDVAQEKASRPVDAPARLAIGGQNPAVADDIQVHWRRGCHRSGGPQPFTTNASRTPDVTASTS